MASSNIPEQQALIEELKGIFKYAIMVCIDPKSVDEKDGKIIFSFIIPKDYYKVGSRNSKSLDESCKSEVLENSLNTKFEFVSGIYKTAGAMH